MELNKYSGLIAIALFILLGATTPVMTYTSVALSFATACFLGYIFIKEPGPWAGKIIITLLCLQNLCIGVGAHLAGNTDGSLKLLSQIPFMTIFLIWFSDTIYDIKSTGIKKFLRDKTNILFILLLACIVLSLFSGHGSIEACLVSVRNMTVFYMSYKIGMRMVHDTDDLTKYIRFFIIVSVIMCILGFILMAGGYELYRVLGVHEVYIAKASPFAQGRLADVFLRIMNGKLVQRMASVYFEPVNLAYLLAAALLCAVYENPFKSRAVKAVSVIFVLTGLILTLGKGGYAIIAICVGCLAGEWIFRKLFNIDHEKCSDSVLILFMVMLALAGAAVVVILLVMFWNGRELIMPHIRGVTGAMNSVVKQPLGHGLGTGGNAALAFNGNIVDSSQWYSVGGETALMSFMYQIGVHGIIIFMMSFLSIGFRKVIKMQAFEKVLFCIPWALICVSVLQDNTFTPQCIVPFMLLVGGGRRVYMTGVEK